MPGAGDALVRRLLDGPTSWVALEDHVPLPDCLEWRLSRAYWDLRGGTAFFGGEVPYHAINDGRLSCDAARLLIETCQGKPSRAPRVLEVGGGSGLFARLFLDELRERAPALYAATTYVWTDGSPAMVHEAQAHGVFDAHAGRVQLQALTLPHMPELGDAAGRGFDLVIANYAVDNLAATVFELDAESIRELEVRAMLARDLPRRRLRGRSADEWAARLRAGEAGLDELVELYPWFSLDCRHRPCRREEFEYGHLIAQPPAGETWQWLHHADAWRWMEQALALLRPRGAVLIADYGYRPRRSRARASAFQHYGGSLANGLNLEELERFVALQDGWTLAAPETDSAQVLSRWIGRADDRLGAGVFRLVFDGKRRDRALDLMREADDAADAKRFEEARWLYWKARDAAPRCWHVLERWAAFCIAKLKDAEAAAGLANAGLALHPRHPGLWNVLGDAEYERGRKAEAEAAFVRALEVSPRDVRGRLNLSYVLQDRGDHAGALARIAEALALDGEGEWRETLLDRQRNVMLAQTVDARDAMEQQINRFRNIWAPPGLRWPDPPEPPPGEASRGPRAGPD